ncbi:MAG: carbohydrate-binding protein [Fibrobacter sp.]|nr:carbohydrate-binding protein [Fibrobacter sp.]
MFCKGFKRIVLACGVFITIGNAATVDVKLDEEHQVIRGFGGMVHNQWQNGGGLSDADAKLAFGTGEGTIGLNTLRIPVYASSNDFNKEVAAAKSAKKYASDDFILYATPWTSPYAGANQHIKSSDYQKYVDHLNSFTAYMKEQGVPLYAISISNEPDWCGEWACWSADEIYNFTKGYADQMRKNGTKVISTESFKYDKNLYNKVLNDANALKNWDILGAHFYASQASTGDNFFEYKLADQKGVERWMTEHYTESQGSGNYWRKYMKTGDQANTAVYDTVRAMDLAYEIHRGLVIGNFNQYTWWYIRRCYGLIMDKDFGNKLQVPQNEIGKISKRGYVMSQFARFIRPGAIRVGATAKPEANLFASAYKSANGDSVIVVLVNRDYKSKKTVTVNVPGAEIATFHVYTTSEVKNAKDEGEIEVKDGSVTITMDAGDTENKDCIVTLVGVGTPAEPVPREPFGGKVAELPGKIEAENYDVPGTGKDNISFKDNDSENKGGEYRETAVDIEQGGDNYAVGYTEVGEWLEYSVKVTKAGTYPLTVHGGSGSENSSIQFSIDGENVTEPIAVPKTGDDWSVYEDINAGTVDLKEGEHIVRLTIVGDYANVDWFRFGDADEGTTAVSALAQLAQVSGRFTLFDMNGGYVGIVEASDMQSLRDGVAKLTGRAGVYLAKSARGKIVKVQVK